MEFIQLQLIVIVTFFAYKGTCGPVKSVADGLDYLIKFSYAEVKDKRSGALVSQSTVEKAIRKFQKSTGLEVTGVLDNVTMTMMNKPRCGNPEGVGNGDLARRRRKRYTLQGSKWPKTDLTYRVARYTSDMTMDQIDSEFTKAFKVWADASLLTFTPVAGTGPIDIKIEFHMGDHGDGNPFDGPSYTLAHAFYPQYGGDAHFDDDEKWVNDGSEGGVNLFQVAAHELGHSIGLSHSDVPEALMAPIYRGYVPDFTLHEDDKTAVQILYGKPSLTVVTDASSGGRPSLPPTVQPSGDNPCTDGKIDAIFTAEDGFTYAFRGRYYYFLDPSNGFIFKRAMVIKDGWPGLPNNIDAAIGNLKGHTYFFKAKRYWKFTNRVPADNNPQTIAEHWKDIPNNMDAIFKWGGNGKIYAMKGRHYWKQDGGKDYPRPLEVWKNLPKTIDAAMLWTQSGFTYFFSGPYYYRFNDRTFEVDRNYPKLTSQWWFECDKSGKIVQPPRTGASRDRNLGEMANVRGNPWDPKDNGDTSPSTTETECPCKGSRAVGQLILLICSICYYFLCNTSSI